MICKSIHRGMREVLILKDYSRFNMLKFHIEIELSYYIKKPGLAGFFNAL